MVGFGSDMTLHWRSAQVAGAFRAMVGVTVGNITFSTSGLGVSIQLVGNLCKVLHAEDVRWKCLR